VTSLHKDNYENIYVQILGQKHFVLLPPLFYPCVDERPLPPAIYVRDPDAGELKITPEDGEDVVWACWDPDSPEASTGRYGNLARPIRVTLEKGDMLYLPRLWYHKVSQSCGQEGICCAVNYWYVPHSYACFPDPVEVYFQEQRTCAG
jgi:jumonji domain-containing protein 7